ncbi:hypothetical protein COEREDRAFT_79000 [Coemansia reversa NRRL 1564]|uniref:Transcription initiation factor TFIID subunit 1 histone acetyltransferase domain-containing protein n=1 Tax=Coemansia reversa (strain ATCC 12441 / NRRL 1564) TaxID=763665 RepID=A0A2G5BL23_COERN|nr:hypothetical protein COEREDRAFT_79000 [Coemansia reversa NRRL 1564]|eukprot:PIA19709.1 hypothetical protein COEREDRAFT_79000 [Coemansia reversa NRRL 1564]
MTATSAHTYESPAIRPAQDAIDYSDFNELADDAAVPKRWGNGLSQTALAAFKYGTAMERAQVDDDYDSEEGGDTSTTVIQAREAESSIAATLSLPPSDRYGDRGAVLGEPTNTNGVEQSEYLESDEEIFEDLFESPAQTSTTEGEPGGLGSVDNLKLPGEAVPPPTDYVSKDDVAAAKGEAQDKHGVQEAAVVPRGVKRIPPGTIRFTDYFGCKIVHRVKRPRRKQNAEVDNEELDTQRLAPVQPVLDTRKLLTGTHDIERAESFLNGFISRTMAADDKSDMYVTIDANTGSIKSQIMRPKRPVDSSTKLFERMPFPLDIEDWEEEVIWQDANVKQEDLDQQQELVLQPKNMLLEDYEKHIVWDSDTPFQPYTQLQINLNDTHMLFEDANSIKESNAREAERQRLLEGVDRFNLSNDHFYEALQEGKVHRVRQTFGQLIIAHSLPSLRLQPPYFKMRNSRLELRRWHRPCLQAPVDSTITFSRMRSAKKRKQKFSMENPWAAKDVTLKDTADCVLIEYSEEYPLVLSNVGMGSVLVNYYRKRNIQDRSFPKVDLGELFILDIADISPFLNFGNIEPGQIVPALYNNMFRAPLFAQKARSTDFLVIKHVSKSDTKWYVRGIKYQYVCGQTYPLQEVPAPHSRKVTTTIKHRLQVAAYRLMSRNQYHLLQMGKLSRLFPEYSELQIRQRLKEFCEYQRKGLGAGYWRPKHSMPLPDEENLRKMLTPEMLCLFESMRVCQQQLHDAGKLGEGDEDDAEDAADSGLSIEELLATWNLTRNFINATQGKAMLKLHGEGDPTGKGEGFSFVRVSMKDIFLRAGESVEEKLAEIEARPKSAHRYNVAEQQQIYKEEITCTWNKQFRALTRPDPPAEHESESWADENVIVPEINDMFGDSATGSGIAAIDPSRMVAGSAMDVSQKLSRGINNTQTTTAHANFIYPNRKGLVIRRAVKSPYTGELMWRTEVIRELAVIQSYLRQRRIIENLAYGNEDLFDDDDDEFGNSASMEPRVDLAGETRTHLGRLRRAKEQRAADARAHEKTHMTTFSLPQPNKPKKEVIRRCGNCGELGHMKTNKKCPRYFEFNPV